MGRETGDSHKHQYLHCSLHSPTSSQLVLFALTCQGGLEVGEPLALVLGHEPDDLVGAICFLASDEAAFITGQVISVSGGLTMAG